MDACTVTAPDAITAFAVPNPGYPSQSRRFFRVWSPSGLPHPADHPAYFGCLGYVRQRYLSAVDKARLQAVSPSVNAHDLCMDCASQGLFVGNRIENIWAFITPGLNLRIVKHSCFLRSNA